MIDSYIILNRKPRLILKLFVIIIFGLMILVIWGINTFQYHSFFHIHSQILKINNLYYLEILVPAKEVQFVTNKTILEMNSKKYNYQVYQIDQNVVYLNNANYLKVYLKVVDLEQTYQFNGYQVEVIIEKERKKIIDYIIEYLE